MRLDEGRAVDAEIQLSRQVDLAAAKLIFEYHPAFV
jgi:hypothetical protein